MNSATSTWLEYLLFVLFISLITGIRGSFNLIIKRFENCDPTVDYLNKYYATFRTDTEGKQYVDGNATLRTAIDDNLKANFTVELLIGKSYMHVIKLEQRHTCFSIHRYMGEFAYDIERAAQLLPGLCPIPPGRYHVHNHLLNFNLLTLQNFPFGHLRMNYFITDKQNKLVTCLILEVENQNL